MDALKAAAKLSLPDWWIAAGFVRNMIWDKLHGYEKPTPLNDVDLIYFDPLNTDPDQEEKYEAALKAGSNYSWSVKNQARMHIRNEDAPYTSSSDAMSYWVEVEAAIGANITGSGEISLIAPFGLEIFFSNSITLNQKRIKRGAFKQRIDDKQWLKLWPKLKICD
jgi:hypothetical protein